MNDTPNNDAASEPIGLAEVLAEELKNTRGLYTSHDTLEEVFARLHEAELTALCFSGGGIRSATFGLGIVQSLAKHGLLGKFDYLSTVSGGGYLGSWLSAWVCREHAKRPNPDDRDFGIQQVQDNINCRETHDPSDPNPEPPQLQHLREYSNYMSPKKGLLSADTWTLGATYLRNLFLNLAIFVPLIAAVLLLPRFLFRGAMQVNPNREAELWMLIGAMLAGSFAVAFVMSRLPSKTPEKEESVAIARTKWDRFMAFLNTDAGVLAFGVCPLVLSAFLATTLFAWTSTSGTELNTYEFFSFTSWGGMDTALAYFLVASAIAYTLGLVFFLAIRFKQAERDLWGGVAAFLSSLVGGALLWAFSAKLFPLVSNWFVVTLGPERIEKFLWQLYIIVSVPVFLLIVLASASLFVGLTSRTATDEDREWLARYGAWVLIACGIWIVLNGLVLLGPSALQWAIPFFSQLGDTSPEPSRWGAIISTITAAVSGFITLYGGFSDKGLVRNEPSPSITSRVLAYAPRIAAVIFLVFILVAHAYLGTWLLYQMALTPSLYHVTALQVATVPYLALLFFALGVVGVVMAVFVNVNKFSLHGAYRDRLVRAYLGASNAGRKQDTFTGFDDNDNIELHKLEHQRPLHVINATVNLVGGKNLAWQDRKAASFTMSPLHCGSTAVKGYRHSRDYCKSTTSRKALRLGTAMAISGAAANPNMGYYSSSVVTFLMSLFNIRLGWWLGNTGERGSDYHWFGLGRWRYFEKVAPSIAVFPLINETLGRTDEDKRFLMVTDGGHFENLALYEMVLRRCKFIVLSDGAADFDFKFGEIANAIQKCKVDLGVDIKLLGTMGILSRTATDSSARRTRLAIALITYPEKDANGNNYRGWLLYTRPTYYAKDEPRDVRYYAESNTKFPHQSTGDQMYDEKQFEAYRSLGFLTMEEIIGDNPPGDLLCLIKNELEYLAQEDAKLAEVVTELFERENCGPLVIKPAGTKPKSTDDPSVSIEE